MDDVPIVVVILGKMNVENSAKSACQGRKQWMAMVVPQLGLSNHQTEGLLSTALVS